jgi:hypothetical protein
MPKGAFKALQAARVRGVELRISRVASKPPHPGRAPHSGRPSRTSAHRAKAKRLGGRKGGRKASHR